MFRNASDRKLKKSALLLFFLITAILVLNFNFEAFRAGAQVPDVVGQGTPGFVAKWIPPTFDFNISNSGNMILVQNSTATNNINVAFVTGFSQLVTFTIAGLPLGVSASFTPIGCYPTCVSILTLSATAGAQLGNFTITVSGRGGVATKATVFQLEVIPFDFSMTDSGPVTTYWNNTVSTGIFATLIAGNPQAVTFSHNGLPPNTTGTFSPTNCTPSCATTLTIVTTATTPAATYPVTITASGGGVSRSVTFSLTVLPAEIISFFAIPEPVNTGGATTIRWETRGFTACTLNDDNPQTYINGEDRGRSCGIAGFPACPKVNLATTTVFTLTCDGMSRSIEVKVKKAPSFIEIAPP